MLKLLKNKLFLGVFKSFDEEVSRFNLPRIRLYLYLLNKNKNVHFSLCFFNIEFFCGFFDNLNLAIIDNWIHYIHFGRRVGHIKFVNDFYFDEKYYTETYHPDLSGFNCALEHYLEFGWKEGYNPSHFFDTNYYIKKYLKNNKKSYCPFEYYLRVGFSKGHSPFAVRFFSDEYNCLKQNKITELPFIAIHNKNGYTVPFVSVEEVVIDSFIVFLPLGIGDAVTAEPIFRYLKLNYPEKNLYSILYKGQAEVCKFNRNIDGIIVVDKNEDIRATVKALSLKTIMVNCVINGIPMACGKSRLLWFNPVTTFLPTTYFDHRPILSALSVVAGLPELDVNPIFWEPEKETIGENSFFWGEKNYIVIHCSSADKRKNWSALRYNSLASKLIDKGYFVVEIGIDQIIHSNSEKYKNFTKKLSFFEIYKLIKQASLFIGPDSVFLHFANCAKIKALCIAGPVKNFYAGTQKIYTKQTPCCGDYYKGINIEFCYPLIGDTLKTVPVDLVYKKAKSLLSG